MINDDLLAKFARLEDLPVSEELLGAYVEGNLSEGETFGITSMINDNLDLSTIVDEISVLDTDNIIGMPTIEEDLLINSYSLLDSVTDEIVKVESYNEIVEFGFSESFSPFIYEDLPLTADTESPDADFMNDSFSVIGDNSVNDSDYINPGSDIGDDNELFNENQDFFS